VTQFLLLRLGRVLALFALVRIGMFSRGRVKRTRRTRRNDASLHGRKALYLQRGYVLEGIATILHSPLVEQRRRSHSPLHDVSRFPLVRVSATPFIRSRARKMSRYYREFITSALLSIVLSLSSLR